MVDEQSASFHQWLIYCQKYGTNMLSIRCVIMWAWFNLARSRLKRVASYEHVYFVLIWSDLSAVQVISTIDNAFKKANLDKNMPRKRHWSHMAALGISDRLQITDYNHWFLCQFTFENKIKIHQWSWPSYEVNANTMRTQWYQLCYNNRDIARPQIWRRLGCDEVSGVFFR